MIARILGWSFVFLALAALGGELLLSVQEGGYDALALSDLWQQIHAKSFIATEHVFLGTPMDWFWDPVMLTVLACPTWILMGLLAALFLHWGRRRRHRGVVL